MVRVGINGFGRIGRSVFRVLAERGGAGGEVVAINDLYDNQQLAYLLRFDSVMGRFAQAVTVTEDTMTVGGKTIAMTAERDPAQIPWGRLGVDVVIESTGVFKGRDDVGKHLAGGTKRVILTEPPKEDLDAMVVIGVNDHILRPEHRLVSNASCTTNCLAPLALAVHEAFGIEEGLMTTVHAYTNSQHVVDVPDRELRRSRAAAANAIPTTTGAARAVGKVLPALAGRLNGMAVRVPVPDGSVVDLQVRLARPASAAEINAALAAAAAGKLRGILEYSEDPLVSSDILGNPHSSIFDALSTKVLPGGYARLLSWYDNEWGYSNRVVDLIGRLAALG